MDMMLWHDENPNGSRVQSQEGFMVVVSSLSLSDMMLWHDENPGAPKMYHALSLVWPLDLIQPLPL